jgi:hypothetical protein
MKNLATLVGRANDQIGKICFKTRDWKDVERESQQISFA